MARAAAAAKRPPAPAAARRVADTARVAAAKRAGHPAKAAPRTRLRIVRRGRVAARPAAAGLLDRLVRGPGWIALVGVLLAGLVFFNVSLLEVNRGITRHSERAAELRRANAELRLRVAKLASSERIQRAAAARGFVLPAPGEVRYLRADPARDARLAARRIEPPPQAPAVAQQAPAPAEQPAPVAPQPAPVAPRPAPAEQPPATAPGHTHPPAQPPPAGAPVAQQPAGQAPTG